MIVHDQQAPAVFLEGSAGYYPRFGFEPGEPLGFRKPSLRIPDAAGHRPAYCPHPCQRSTSIHALIRRRSRRRYGAPV
jgi:hypothetical protein